MEKGRTEKDEALFEEDWDKDIMDGGVFVDEALMLNWVLDREVLSAMEARLGSHRKGLIANIFFFVEVSGCSLWRAR